MLTVQGRKLLQLQSLVLVPRLISRHKQLLNHFRCLIHLQCQKSSVHNESSTTPLLLPQSTAAIMFSAAPGGQES
jgi:hypothetical protein